MKAGMIKWIFRNWKLCRHRDSNPQHSNPRLLHCSCHLPYRVFGLLLLTRHGRALTGSQYSEGPSCGCYNHSFGRQQANPEPVHTIRVAIHLLDSHAPATLPGNNQGLCFLVELTNFWEDVKLNLIIQLAELYFIAWMSLIFFLDCHFFNVKLKSALYASKYLAVPETKLRCLGISPGKSPFGAFMHFPLQSGQGMWGVAAQISLWPFLHMGDIPANFGLNQPRNHSSLTCPLHFNWPQDPWVRS